MGSLDDALDEAENMTNDQLTQKILSTVRINFNDLQVFFPAYTDKQKLYELIRLVRAATDDNTKKQAIINKIGDYAGIFVNLIKMLV